MSGLIGIGVRDAAKNLSPKVVARYCHDLADSFNSFYEHNKVLGIGDEKLEDARVCLVNSFKMTIEKSLDLLGIVRLVEDDGRGPFRKLKVVLSEHGPTRNDERSNTLLDTPHLVGLQVVSVTLATF